MICLHLCIGTSNGEPLTEVEKKQQLQYEDWLMQHAAWVNMNVKHHEAIVAKHRKTKKSLNAKQRSAKKNGGDLSETDQLELERTTTEQAGVQKTLEGFRKQQRQHQQLINDYRMKQQVLKHHTLI